MPFILQQSQTDSNAYSLYYSDLRDNELDKILTKIRSLDSTTELILQSNLFAHCMNNNNITAFLDALDASSINTILLSVGLMNNLSIHDLTEFAAFLSKAKISVIQLDMQKSNLDAIDYPKLVLLDRIIKLYHPSLTFKISQSGETYRPKNIDSAINIFHENVDVETNFDNVFSYLLDAKPENDKECLDSLLVSNNVCMPNTRDQLLDDFLPEFIPSNIIPKDLIELYVGPFGAVKLSKKHKIRDDLHVKISPKFYSNNPQLYNRYIERLFQDISEGYINSSTEEQFNALMPFLNDDTLVAIQKHASHYEMASIVDNIRELLSTKRTISHLPSFAMSKVIQERTQAERQKDHRSYT